MLFVRHAVQPRVAAAERQQLIVAALLRDAPVLEHDDAVGVADRREPVRDDERRAAFEQLVERPLDDRLRLAVTFAVASSRIRMRGRAMIARAKLSNWR